MQFEKLNELMKNHPRRQDLNFSYNVSGVRGKSILLDSVVFRTALLATLRSLQKNGDAIGLMITASHNPSEDNGVKLIEPNGEMLSASWLNFATEIINKPDNELIAWLQNFLKQFPEIISNLGKGAQVFIGQDTRESSPQLAVAAQDGILSLNGHIENYGLLTTPQLHFIVQQYNLNPSIKPSEETYYEQLTKSFAAVCERTPVTENYKSKIIVDCANGVGGPKFQKLLPRLQPYLTADLIHTGEHILNFKCGADYVKVDQKPPEGIQLQIGQRYASFDGDADRLIYFYANLNKKFALLDGDRIAVLSAIYFKQLLHDANLLEQLSLCVVQTAYANGSSTEYLINVLQLPVHCVATGILNLHEKAAESDLGIYFEANGHGTVLFSEKAKKAFENIAQKQLKQEFLSLVNLINQSTGDAFSDLLLVETILRRLDWSESDWAALYEDLPQRQLKIPVKDRTLFKVTKDERQCIEPQGLQQKIDIIVSKYGPLARSFVRPSQTEHIVRVYAEAKTQDKADQLAEEIKQVLLG